MTHAYKRSYLLKSLGSKSRLETRRLFFSPAVGSRAYAVSQEHRGCSGVIRHARYADDLEQAYIITVYYLVYRSYIPQIRHTLLSLSSLLNHDVMLNPTLNC